MKTSESTRPPKYSDLIYDVGMHRGEDTLFYLRKGFRCIAFEADPENVIFCKKLFAEFIDRGQLKIVEGAIIDRDKIMPGQKTVKFYKNENLSVLGTISSDWAAQNEKLGSPSNVIEVNIINFAEEIRKNGIPHYLKIDIEGCDIACLKALDEFKEFPDYVSFEADRTAFANNKHEIGLLAKLGYRSFQVVEQSEGTLAQVPPFPPKEGQFVAHTFEKNSSGMFGAELASPWKSREEILRLCFAIRIGHYLLGISGVMTGWKFKGSRRLRWYASRLVRSFTNTAVPGWHDIHARLN